MVFIGARDGEIARLVEEHRCGLVVRPGDAAVLAMALRWLSTNGHVRAAMGARARDMLDRHFSRQKAFARWTTLLETLETADGPGSTALR